MTLRWDNELPYDGHTHEWTYSHTEGDTGHAPPYEAWAIRIYTCKHCNTEAMEVSQ